MTEVSAQAEGAKPQGKKPGKAEGIASLPARIVRFLRESVAELRRVVWPTKQQVTTYTSVVLTFVVIMALLIFAIDYVAGQGVLFVFGS